MMENAETGHGFRSKDFSARLNAMSAQLRQMSEVQTPLATRTVKWTSTTLCLMRGCAARLAPRSARG